MDLSASIGLQVFESQEIECVKCGGNLQRITKNGGTFCVSFGNTDGPKVGICYRKHCSKCKIKYEYGKRFKEEGKAKVVSWIQWMPLSKLKYIQVSTCSHVLSLNLMS